MRATLKRDIERIEAELEAARPKLPPFNPVEWIFINMDAGGFNLEELERFDTGWQLPVTPDEAARLEAYTEKHAQRYQVDAGALVEWYSKLTEERPEYIEDVPSPPPAKRYGTFAHSMKRFAKPEALRQVRRPGGGSRLLAGVHRGICGSFKTHQARRIKLTNASE